MGQMIQELRDWKSQQNRQPIEEMLNNVLMDYTDGSNDTTKQKKLLQLPSGQDKQSSGWRHDRRDPGPWVQSDEEGESENCRCGHPREKDEEPRGERTWD